MAKRKSGKGSSTSKRPVKRKAAAKTKKPAGRAAKKAAPKKAASPKKVAAPRKVPASKPLARPGQRRPVKSRTSVTRLAPPRPVSHKTALAAHNIYERDLDKTPANHAALTPLQFIERTASVYPDHVALIHGERRQTWAETYARCRRLASALARVGIGVGDTVAIMAPNIPEMYEAHFGVPMTGGVLNSLNTRLDAAMVAFILDHSETKVLLVDREYHRVVTEALAIAKVQPLVVDIDDPECDDRAQIGDTTWEEFIADGDPDFAWAYPVGRMERDLAQLHLGHHRQPQGRGLQPPRRRRSRPTATPRNGRSACTRSISGRCRCSTATAGASPGRWRWSPALRSACAAPRAKPIFDALADHDVTPHVRRADHHAADHRRDAGRTSAAPAQGRVHDRGRAAARRRARGAGEAELPRHPRLWPDRGLRPGHDLRLARRMGRAAGRTSRRG